MSSTKFARPHRPSVEELAQGVLAGNRALLGRAITLVESNAAKYQEASRDRHFGMVHAAILE